MSADADDTSSDGLPVILLVEDNPDDVLLTRRAVRKAGIEVRLVVVGDGDEAVAYLGGAAPYLDRAAHPLPRLILLDLKLPKRSGLDVLQWVRARDHLVTVPVVVLTSSSEDQDIRQAYQRGANSYLQKPVAFSELVKMLGALGLYWFEHNLTHPRSAASY
ncbi:MAG: response regulator [Gammaproteobacteria bacterium]